MIDRDRLRTLRTAEEQRFVETHPRSAELAEEARGSLLAGVPMPWMTRWAGAFPVFVDEARGARCTDVDGHEYVDLCLGDTGAMTGHAHRAGRRGACGSAPSTGITTMLPELGRGLGRRGAGPALRAAAVAVRPVGHRRQPVRAPVRPLPHRPARRSR